MLRFGCFNLNGLKSSVDKGLLNYIQSTRLHFYCFQETRISDSDNIKSAFSDIGYDFFNNQGLIKQNGGTGFLIRNDLLSKVKCYRCVYDKESSSNYGRVSLLIFNEEIYVFNLYLHYTKSLDSTTLEKIKLFNQIKNEIKILLHNNKKVICCGDFNIRSRNFIKYQLNNDYFEDFIQTELKFAYKRYPELDNFLDTFYDKETKTLNTIKNWKISFDPNNIIIESNFPISQYSDPQVFKELEIFEYFYELFKLEKNKKMIETKLQKSIDLINPFETKNYDRFTISEHFMLDAMDSLLTKRSATNYNKPWVIDYIYSNINLSTVVDNNVKLSDHPFLLCIADSE